MKLEDVMKAYKKNEIEAVLEKMDTSSEKAGVINFGKGISASYLLDNEDIIICLKIFITCLIPGIDAVGQLQHAIKTLRIIQNTINIIANLPQKECNMILKELGLFNKEIKGDSRIRHLDHQYSLEVIDGILCFSIIEEQ